MMLKSIDTKARVKAVSCPGLQFGNGIKPRGESIIHALRKVSGRLEDGCILSLDATNAFREIRRKVMLNNKESRMPEIYLNAWNLYAQPSYTIINEERIKVNRGQTPRMPSRLHHVLPSNRPFN